MLFVALPHQVQTDADYVDQAEGHSPQQEKTEHHREDALEHADDGRGEGAIVGGAQEKGIVEHTALQGKQTAFVVNGELSGICNARGAKRNMRRKGS